jgi:hypothetical protein
MLDTTQEAFPDDKFQLFVLPSGSIYHMQSTVESMKTPYIKNNKRWWLYPERSLLLNYATNSRFCLEGSKDIKHLRTIFCLDCLDILKPDKSHNH